MALQFSFHVLELIILTFKALAIFCGLKKAQGEALELSCLVGKNGLVLVTSSNLRKVTLLSPPHPPGPPTHCAIMEIIRLECKTKRGAVLPLLTSGGWCHMLSVNLDRRFGSAGVWAQ